MLRKLTIRFDVRDAPDEVGVATTLLDLTGKLVWEGPTTLKEPTTIRVPAGRYLVRARLPSGDVLGQVSLHDTTTVVLRLDYSSGRSVFAPAYYLNFPSRSSPGMFLHDSDLTLRVRANTGAWRAYPIELQTGPYGGGCEVVYADPSGTRGAFVELRFAPDREHAQKWLSVRSQMFAIPSGFAGETVVEARADEFAVSVHNARGDADALLAYLICGDFASARAIGPRLIDIDAGLWNAHALLHGYVPNPGAAAVGGYYLLRAVGGTLSGPQGALVFEWARDVAKTFSTLADAAVVLGWLALRRGESVVARDAFVEACRRGIPQYTMGVRYLIDGLNILNNSAVDSDVLRASEWLASYSSSVDWTVPTTALSIDAPFLPFDAAPLELKAVVDYRRRLRGAGHDEDRETESPNVIEADRSTLDSRISVLASFTAPPFFRGGAASTTRSVHFTKVAASAFCWLSTVLRSDRVELVQLLKGIRDDPWAFENVARLGPAFRYAILTAARAEWRVVFMIEEESSTITILRLERWEGGVGTPVLQPEPELATIW